MRCKSFSYGFRGVRIPRYCCKHLLEESNAHSINVLERLSKTSLAYNSGPLATTSRKVAPSSSHYGSSGWAAAWPRLGRALRIAPLSRQTETKRVWHSPRFPSRPAILLRPPFCSFYQDRLVFSRFAPVKKKTSRSRQKGKKHEIR